MSGINKVILIGNLGQDPETRNLPSGIPVSNISIATSKSWKDKETGQKKEQTEWHRCVAFNRLAEVINEYLRKGSKVYIEGELRTRQWERDGQKHYTTEVNIRELLMLDSREQRPDTSAGSNSADDFGPPPPEDFDDDTPF